MVAKTKEFVKIPDEQKIQHLGPLVKEYQVSHAARALFHRG